LCADDGRPRIARGDEFFEAECIEI
jgi:hypothetical protein